MLNFFEALSDTFKGILIMAVGILLFLHTLGIWQYWLNTALVLIALYMIAWGFVHAGGVVWFKGIMARSKKASLKKEKAEKEKSE